MSIEIQCITEKLIVITIKLDYSKVPSKSTVPTMVVECSRIYDLVLARRLPRGLENDLAYSSNLVARDICLRIYIYARSIA